MFALFSDSSAATGTIACHSAKFSDLRLGRHAVDHDALNLTGSPRQLAALAFKTAPPRGNRYSLVSDL
ncbi:MAG: hypothetical protein WD894_05290 [Pirellulales bacterium]